MDDNKRDKWLASHKRWGTLLKAKMKSPRISSVYLMRLAGFLAEFEVLDEEDQMPLDTMFLPVHYSQFNIETRSSTGHW